MGIPCLIINAEWRILFFFLGFVKKRGWKDITLFFLINGKITWVRAFSCLLYIHQPFEIHRSIFGFQRYFPRCLSYPRQEIYNPLIVSWLQFSLFALRVINKQTHIRIHRKTVLYRGATVEGIWKILWAAKFCWDFFVCLFLVFGYNIILFGIFFGFFRLG